MFKTDGEVYRLPRPCVNAPRAPARALQGRLTRLHLGPYDATLARGRDYIMNHPCRRRVTKPAWCVQATAVLACALGLFLVASCNKDSDAKPDSGPDAGPDLIVAPDLPPADLSEDKKLKITAIIPVDGPACPFKAGGAADNCDGLIPITLIGQNFEAGMTVYVDGGGGYIITTVDVPSAASASFALAKQPYDSGKPFKAFVSVRMGAQQSNDVSFYYWVPKDPDADNIGSLVSDVVEAYTDYFSETISGRVYVKGMTDTTTGSAPAKLRVEFGVSVPGKDPIKDFSFKWFPATYKSDDGTYDVFEGAVKPVLAADFDIAMRFSTDNGESWIFVDRDETDPTYDPAKLGQLKVTAPPLGYCQKQSDCIDMFKKACEVDPADWKKNQCVECLSSKDCTDNPMALGPTCDTAHKLCVCAGDPDCAKNSNGKKCLPDSYCGCQQPTDCEEPNVCYQDFPVKGLFGCGPPKS